jgi:hypothetical protein
MSSLAILYRRKLLPPPLFFEKLLPHCFPEVQNTGHHSPLGHIKAGFADVDKGFGGFACQLTSMAWFAWRQKPGDLLGSAPIIEATGSSINHQLLRPIQQHRLLQLL